LAKPVWLSRLLARFARLQVRKRKNGYSFMILGHCGTETVTFFGRSEPLPGTSTVILQTTWPP
jgi:hypothetical protein